MEQIVNKFYFWTFLSILVLTAAAGFFIVNHRRLPERHLWGAATGSQKWRRPGSH
jgi:hypothetical protein